LEKSSSPLDARILMSPRLLIASEEPKTNSQADKKSSLDKNTDSLNSPERNSWKSKAKAYLLRMDPMLNF
jgi:hypothetical protein